MNKRPNAPMGRSQRPAQGAAPRRQGANVSRPQRGPAPRPQREIEPRRQAAPAARSGGADLVKLIIGGAIAVALAFGLQCFWPNGFPLVEHTTDSAGAVSRITEIYSEGALRINEVMTSNRNTLGLEDGSSPDWIEIINTGSKAVNLEGMSLAKSENDTRVFTFPGLELKPGECVLVYADSRLRTDAGQALHAPFRLSSAGDTLMLFNAAGAAIDTVNLPALGGDQSYARMGSFEWQSCDTATPSLSNTRESYMALSQPAGDSPVVFNELVASNSSVIADENGQYYDYIELYNRSSEAVSLSGWYLSDDAQSLRKWRIPDVTLGAGQYLVVFASGLDRSADPAHLHTNFSLSSEGEELLLTDSQGRLMEKMSFDLLKENVAFSRGSDGSWSGAQAPSPGRANG